METAMIFKEVFQTFISNSKARRRTYLTLGPEGTSSRQAAAHLASRYPGRVKLFETYEAAAEAVNNDPGNNALIVANAYAAINCFYISHHLYPAAAFFHDTPEYVIAVRNRTALEAGRLTIASHQAPRHLIAPTLGRQDVMVIDAKSTHRAAELVVCGEADACLTTRTAADILRLEVTATAIPTIPMLWTVFISKEHNKWKRKALSSCLKACPMDLRPTSQP